MTNIVQVWVDNWFGVVGSITPAFKEYAVSLSLAYLNLFCQALQLPLPNPVTTNHLTEISGSPRVDGLTGGVVVSNRFSILISSTKVERFLDIPFSSTYSKSNFFERLAEPGSALSQEAAVRIATNALARLGISNSALEKKQPSIRQVTAKDETLLPYYYLDWGNLRIEVSGAASNIVHLYNSSPAPALRIPLPTNYFEIVGATNEALRTPQTKLRPGPQRGRE